MKRTASLIAFGVLLTFAAAFGVTGHAADPPKSGGAVAGAARDALSSGEVKNVDKGSGKITIKHGPLPNLDMPGMTMAFRVSEPAMLDHVKAGDRIKFRAEQV